LCFGVWGGGWGGGGVWTEREGGGKSTGDLGSIFKVLGHTASFLQEGCAGRGGTEFYKNVSAEALNLRPELRTGVSFQGFYLP